MDRYNKEQTEYFKRRWTISEFRPKQNPIINYFANLPLNMLVDLFPINFLGESVHIACGGGEGFEVKRMVEMGAKITATDISKEALSEIKKNFPKVKTKVADMNNLPFADNLFDYGLVKDGLHHLKNPYRGISELYRVSKKGIFIIDFQETFVTRFLINLGLSARFEESGNLNYKFKKKELVKYFGLLSPKKYIIKSLFVHEPVFKAAMFSSKTGIKIVGLATSLFNKLFSRYGNILIAGMLKQ